MADDLQVGDTVQLTSGGPKMTIDHIGQQFEGSKDKQALCSWFEKNKRQRDWFELTSLRKVNSEGQLGTIPLRRG